MFDDGVTLALGRALDGVAMRQRVNAHNIANTMTPGYRAQKVEFEQALAGALATGDPSAAQATVVETGATPREDGNNVELEVEQGSLLRSGLQYQAVAQAVSFKDALLRTAIRG